MRILLITEFFPQGKDLRFSGGVEARTFFVAKYLAKKHKVTVLTSLLGASSKKEKMLGFEIYRVGPRRNYSPTIGDFFLRIKFITEALSFAKNLDLELVEGSNFLTHFIAWRIARRKKIKAVAWYPDVWIGNWLKNVGPLGLFGEFLERLNLKLGFDAYIAISRQTARKLKKYTNGKIMVIPCGVEQKEFRSAQRKFAKPTIISVTRLTKYKNLKNLIFAFAHLSKKIKDSRLIIIGTGPDYHSLKNLISALKLPSKVRFLLNLPRNKLLETVKKSHLFCMTSRVEGFGIATIEATAAGLPYVISDIPVHREVTKNGQGGFLVNPNRPIEISQKLRGLLTDHNLYRKKQKEAIRLAHTYNWQKISKETEKLYQSLL